MPRQLYTVTVSAHHVEGPYVCYLVDASSFIVTADGKREACAEGCRRSHTFGGVPPWKPYLRQAWEHASAEPYVGALEQLTMSGGS